MKHLFRLVLIAALGLGLLACSSSNNGDDGESEFIATLDDFKDYKSWALVDTAMGPDPFLGQAHGGGPLTRSIYFKDDAMPQDGEYPKGTIILKELTDANDNVVGALTMLVKRGGDFNPDGNGWEWFMTTTDLDTVMTQGDNATAGGGACAGCHAQANSNNNGTDWVFSHR